MESKDAVLKLQLVADSGYLSQEETRITPSQWGSVVSVLHNEHKHKLFIASPDVLNALELMVESFGYYDLELTDNKGMFAIESAKKAIEKALK
tara:strand:+ start:908 stop:1186 length:279 start_codon:yes stop_codon:yes gene_type:complete